MLRIDALREIHPILKDQLVVTIMGAWRRNCIP